MTDTVTKGYLLACLMEEAGEVTQAAGKCLRFGLERHQPGYGVNDHVLAAEVGDLLGIADALGLSSERIEQHRKAKLGKIIRHRGIAEPEPMLSQRDAKP